MLDKKTHLPAVLQSLGCIAQTAMPVFETRESEIEGFIKCEILKCSSVCHLKLLDLFSLSSDYDFLIISFHLKACVAVSESRR